MSNDWMNLRTTQSPIYNRDCANPINDDAMKFSQLPFRQEPVVEPYFQSNVSSVHL